MTAGAIRPLAICLFMDRGRVLVAEGYDPVKGETFYRPLGGAIEFGETAADALVRELREEVGADITALRPMGALENIFTFNGEPGHEIVLVFDGEFVDRTIYKQPVLQGREHDGSTFRAVWKHLEDFVHGPPPLYPDGLLELLRGGD